MKEIKNKVFDEERALYNLKDRKVTKCKFEGEKDGESVLKECRNIEVSFCEFGLRYPLWHADNFLVKYSNFNENTRAPIWYSKMGVIRDCVFKDIKLLRECSNVLVSECDIDSTEFGWKCNYIKVDRCKLISEYVFLDSKNIEFNNSHLDGKFSFQYVENLEVNNCNLKTKDAFWHSKNVTVRNSIIQSEYLGWFSENLTLINCQITGTQPLCYCKNLKLIGCTMEGTDLSFEYSEVEADIKGNVVSIKNPKSGTIIVDSVGVIIKEDSIMESNAQIIIRDKN